MRRVELSGGPVEYHDAGGAGPCLVLLHGLLMSGSLWKGVVEALPTDVRVVCPTWPLGGHRLPMNPDADLSLAGHARLIGEFFDALELEDVTLVFNDWCAAQLLVAEGLDTRVARLMLVSCETADNYPPGLPGRTAVLAARIPGGIYAALQGMRLRPLRRLPVTFGWMANGPIPDAMLDAWLAPGTTDPAVRRDLRKYAGDISAGRRALAAATAGLARFTKPVLVVWGSDDRVMPLDSGRRLAAAFPNAEFTTVPGSGNLVPLDQPQALAALLATFLASKPS